MSAPSQECAARAFCCDSARSTEVCCTERERECTSRAPRCCPLRAERLYSSDFRVVEGLKCSADALLSLGAASRFNALAHNPFGLIGRINERTPTIERPPVVLFAQELKAGAEMLASSSMNGIVRALIRWVLYTVSKVVTVDSS